MNKIYLMRHSISVGNEENIIQGINDCGLSKNGINLVKNTDYSFLNNISSVYLSPSHRVIETAEIIRRKLNILMIF